MALILWFGLIPIDCYSRNLHKYMILKFIRNKIIRYSHISAFIAGLLSAIAHAPVFFTPGLLGVSLLLYLIYTSASYKEAVMRNFAFGYGYFGGGLYWIAIAITVYIEDFWWLIPICLIGMPLIFCVFTSLAAVFAWKYRAHKYYVLIYSIAWIFIEWLTSWIFTGLPWMLMGYSVGFSDILSQIASLCGVIGLSLIIFNISGTFYYIWADDAKLLKQDLYYVMCIVLVISAFGVWRLEQYPTQYSDITVRIVQPSIPQSAKWDLDLFWKNLNLHKTLSEINTGVIPDMILWSESAVSAQIQLPMIRKYLNDVAKHTNSVLISGVVSTLGEKSYTAVDAIDSNGKILFEYHKQHLVPFGEYVPWKEFLPIKKLTAGMEDYTAGAGDVVMSLKLKKGDLKIRPLICYESIFADEVKSGDADLLISFMNNAWYGNSSGPYQMFYMSKFRAIENGLPVINVANNGISGVVDALGRIISKTRINDIVSLDCLVPHKISSYNISQSTLGYFVLICVIVAIYMLSRFFKKIQ